MRASLRTRWTVAMLLAGALPLSLLTLLMQRIVRRALDDAERGLEVATIDQVAETIDRHLGDASEATHRVGQLLTDARITDEDSQLLMARETLARAPALELVAVYAPSGELIGTVEREGTAAARPLDRSPGEPPSSAGAWLSSSDESAPLRYAERVERGGQTRAIVAGFLGRNALTARVAEVSTRRFGQGDRVLIFDAERRVIAGVRLRNQPSLPEAAAAHAHLPAALFQQFFAVNQSFEGPGGERVVGSLRTLPSRGWVIAVARPEREAFVALTDVRRVTLASAGGLLLLALAVGAALAGRITRPVRSLVRLTEAYAKREFSAKNPVSTGDELQSLGDAMSAMAGSLEQSEREIARRATVEADLSRFLPSTLASSIADGTADLALGGERRVVTVLFADVVSFTTFAEHAKPERAVAFLNELFGVLTEVVFRHEGTVDKFMGDCLMAFFGAPVVQSDHAVRALSAAEDMHRFVESASPAWKERYGIDVRLAIGVSTGEVLVGNLGSEARMEYTAIGDAVNVGARLESIARPGQTLVTAAVKTHAGDAFEFRPLGSHPLRGRREPVDVLEVT